MRLSRIQAMALALLPLASAPALAQVPPEQAFAGSPAMEEFERRMREDPLLFRLQWKVERFAPGVLFLQLPTRGSDEFVARNLERYGPWLAQLGQLLDERYFQDLPRLRGTFGYSLFVAENQRTFTGIRRSAQRATRDAQAAVTFDDLGMVMAYDRGFVGSRPDSFQRFPVLREVVRESLRQRAQRDALRNWPAERWLVEGLATWHAWHVGDDPEELLAPQLLPLSMEWLKELAAGEPARLEVLLPPLDEYRNARDESSLRALIGQRARAAGIEEPSLSQVSRVDEHLPNLHVAHLATTRPDALAALVEELLAGTADEGLLDRTLGGDAASREQAFRTWVESVLTGRSLAVIQASSPTAEDLVSPGVALQPESTEDWLARSLGRAASGDYAGALVQLELAAEDSAVDGEQLEQLRTRLAALGAARDSLLEQAVGTSKKLRLPHEGKKVSVAVESYEDGVLGFVKSRTGPEQLVVAELPPEALALALGRDAAEYGPAWTVTLGRWLGAEDRWDRNVDEDDPEHRALAELLGSWEPLREAGQVDRLLTELARLQPDSVEEARTLVELLEELMEEHAGTPLVQEKSEALSALGAEALATVYASRGLAERLRGKVESLDDGRSAVTYTFDEPDELEDWFPVPGYMSARRAEKFEVPVSEADTEWRVKGGNLEGFGQAAFRHTLRWKAPLSVQYSLLYGRPEPGQGELGTMLLAICDSGAGSYIGAADIHDLEAQNGETGVMLIEAEQQNRSVKSASTYKMVLTHTGEDRVRLERDGKVLREIDALGLEAGGVVFWLHSQMPMALKQVRIEGYLDSSEVDAGQEEWVTDKLGDMGLYR